MTSALHTKGQLEGVLRAYPGFKFGSNLFTRDCFRTRERCKVPSAKVQTVVGYMGVALDYVHSSYCVCHSGFHPTTLKHFAADQRDQARELPMQYVRVANDECQLCLWCLAPATRFCQITFLASCSNSTLSGFYPPTNYMPLCYQHFNVPIKGITEIVMVLSTHRTTSSTNTRTATHNNTRSCI